jgi:hypothetical protein
VSSNTPRAFARTLISRFPFLPELQSGTASALAKGKSGTASALAKGKSGTASALAKGKSGTASALAKGKSPAVQKRIPAAALAVAALGVAVAPLATSGAGQAQAAASTRPVAASTAKPGAAAPQAPATQAPAAQAPAAQAPAASEPKSTAPAQQPAAQAATEQTKAAAPANPYANVSMAQISPTAEQGSQSHINATPTQWSNATKIVQAAESMGMSPYASTVAVATALQESKLENLTVAVDHDSLGLFQQRPSTGWGSPSELTDPTYAAKAFLKSLPSNYQSVALHTAAQEVQRSFNGWLYAQWQDQAKHMVYTIMHQQ